jgi:hypothetical protein
MVRTMKLVTDPELLKQLEATSGGPGTPVTDPELLKQLEGRDQGAPLGFGRPQDLVSKIYTPLIQGAAMTAGGAAGAVMGAPAGPVGSGLAGVGLAAAMNPPAKRFAASIDQMRGIANPLNQPKPLLRQAQDVAGDFREGVGIEAGGKVLNEAAPLVKPLFRGAAKKMSNVGSVISGAKPQDLMQAYDQGLATYAAPGMAKAGRLFDDAAKAAGINPKPTLDAALDPALSTAKQVALEAGKKMESGAALNAQEALYARQATDRIIAGTAPKDKATLHYLSELRGQFDSALTTASPAMKEASNQYRKSIVKRNLLSPVPVNKGGTPNKLTSILFGLGGLLGGGTERSLAVPLKAAGALVAMSPLVQGFGASASGSAVKTAGRILKSSVGSRTISSAISDKILTESKAREYLKKSGGDRSKAREMAKNDGWSF